MTDTDVIAAPETSSTTEVVAAGQRRSTGLGGMVLAELRSVAVGLGIKGTSGMRKGDLIAAIQAKQGGGGSAAPVAARELADPQAAAPAVADGEAAGGEAPQQRTRARRVSRAAAPAGQVPAVAENQAPAAPVEVSAQPAPAAPTPVEGPVQAQADAAAPVERRQDSERASAGKDSERASAGKDSEREGAGKDSERAGAGKDSEREGAGRDSGQQQDSGPDGEFGGNRRRQRRGATRRVGGPEAEGDSGQGEAPGPRSGGEGAPARTERPERAGAGQQRANQGGQQRQGQPSGDAQDEQQGEGRGRDAESNRDMDDDENGRGRRGRRFRERRRGRDRVSTTEAVEQEVREDEVLQPVAGILDVLDNYAFVRTSGYLAGQSDVYVSMNMVRKNGLRRGDAVTGAVRVVKEGDQANQRQKFNPLVRLDTVNGTTPDAARKRPEFNKLTPLYPNQRLRLETTPNILTTRVIDLIMPIGKGQRALIVSPPKAGKTSVLQAIANAIAVNNPECHLMVVLVDERPEEVTDMQRSVRGEVIASTFDRPPTDHTSVAELAIERAKRLVEDGRDVVVLLDSITRLGRAYNNSSPASGRILSGGVDSTALYPPKRFLGAARNIENGGSLTIIATAMVETGSTGDTVIFEEFKGTGNAELKLDRKIAERRVFPAVDVNPSGTRRDDLLLAPDEAAVVHKLRRVLSGLDSHQAIDLLIAQLRKTRNNMEFLMQVAKTAPGAGED